MSKTINTTEFNAQLTIVFNADVKRDTALALLRDMVKGTDVLLAKELVNEFSARKHGVTRVAKERGTGMTWGMDTASQSAKKWADRTHRDIMGASVAQVEKDKVIISAEARALLVQLDALYASYPEMRAVCNAYIAKASKK